MDIEKQKAEARDRNNLVDHIIKLIESDDKRYSFEWSCGNAMEIYDKEKEVGYVLHIDKIEYDADLNSFIKLSKLFASFFAS